MIHLNEELRQRGSLSEKIQAVISPEIYFAHTISNFEKGKTEVETTGLMQSVLWLYTGINYYRRTCITLVNMHFYHSDNFQEARLEDFNSTLDLPIFNPGFLYSSTLQQGIQNGDKVQEAYVIYFKEKDRSYLLNVAKIKGYNFPERVKPAPTLQKPAAAF